MDNIPLPIVKEILSYLSERDKISARQSSPIFLRCSPSEEYILEIVTRNESFLTMIMEDTLYHGVDILCVFQDKGTLHHKKLIHYSDKADANWFMKRVYKIINDESQFIIYSDDYDSQYIVNRQYKYNIFLMPKLANDPHVRYSKIYLEIRNNDDTNTKPYYLGRYKDAIRLYEVRNKIETHVNKYVKIYKKLIL